jgi:hypothetical protein
MGYNRYDLVSCSYGLWVPETNNIRVSKDAVFTDKVFLCSKNVPQTKMFITLNCKIVMLTNELLKFGAGVRPQIISFISKKRRKFFFVQLSS